MQTPTSSSVSTSLAVESPRLGQERSSAEQGGPDSSPASSSASTPTSRRLTMTLPRVPKMPNFLTLNSPKKLAQQHNQQLETKDKNEPSRFLGDGVSFKAKLIGILEVGEARGDRMCQEALSDLKMAIRAAGEHKQRITINIAIDGLRLRDEKTMDCLYHHPVHKISFIAQDMTDSRAFGYIFGSPDTGHRFFGIKTDKAAGQVVVAMRDLFQVVFELKKKEIELAKQHIEQQQQFKSTVHKSLENISYSKNGSSGTEASGSLSKVRSGREDARENGCIGTSTKSAQQTSEVIADLLDLEIELNSIQQGIHQMEKITPSDPFGPDAVKERVSSSFHDPFEDSFSPPVPSASKAASGHTQPTLLPPPPSSNRSDLISSTSRQGRVSKRHATSNLTLDSTPISPPTISSPVASSSAAPLASSETWFDSQSDPLFGDNNLPINLSAGTNSFSTTSATPGSAGATAAGATPSKREQVEANQFDVFTELDPLGTGKSRPYVDKKDFFQELKNPPKKVLKDLASEVKDGEPPPLFSANFESSSPPPKFSSAISSPPLPSILSATGLPNLDPFEDTDPFGETDPFVDDNVPNSASFPPEPFDPFDTCFADFTMFGSQQSKTKGNAAASVYHGPLRVSLPPEKTGAKTASGGASLLPPPPTSRRTSPVPSKPKSPRLTKQISAGAPAHLVRIPSPKNTQSRTSRRLGKQTTLADTRSGSMLHSPPSPLRTVADEERLSSSSLELTDIAPEPPPRPAASKPPPLPPKRQQQAGLSIKPPPRPPPSEQYDYINHHEDIDDPTSPPLPVPVRRPRSRGSELPGSKHTLKEFSNFSLPPPPAPALAREEKRLKHTGAAANLTLRQLTKMNINELATSLNVSPGHLSKMTLQELASFLAAVSAEGSPASTAGATKREQYSTLRESVDEETFRAEFESNFADFPNNFDPKLQEDVFQEAPFDKYAVFRELVEQEIEKDSDYVKQNEEPECETTGTIVQHNESVPLERSDSAMAEEGRREGDEEEEDEEEEEEDFGEAGIGSDKYAALREICSEPTQPDEESEKDDSVTEAVADKMEEDFNLLTLSRQQSESPESPIQETSTARESQSIIESTIIEEAGSDVDSAQDETLVLDNEDDRSKFKSDSLTEDMSCLEIEESPAERIAPPTALALSAREETKDIDKRDDGWAKFDDGNFEPATSPSHVEDAVSPWSIEDREFSSSKDYIESPEPANTKSRKKYGSQVESPWHDEGDEEDEDWEGRGHRENGWRDERNRGARPRKRSPWGRGPPRKTSPWEDDEEEGDVEEYDEISYKTRPPPVRGSSSERRGRRPPSWDDDDDPEYDEPRPTRRVVGWSGSQQERDRRKEYEEKRERSGSRGEYMDRRRWDSRDEEDALKHRRNVAKYPVGYATWGERGSRKAAQERRSRESVSRRKYDSHYWHYRDQRPVEYDYEDSETYEQKFKAKRTGAWPKRPSSASDVRKAPGRRGFQSPSSSHSHDAGDFAADSFVDRRFRTQSCEQSRGWANDSHDFNSDQEAEYMGEKARELYEQRSHTLHSHRNQKQKRGGRIASDDITSPQQKSPFEDDFSAHSFHASEFSSLDSPSAEHGRKQQEVTDRKDSQFSESELKLPTGSPMEDLQQVRGRETSPQCVKISHTSVRRQSPFEDDFTPPETRRGSARVPSSISSDVSEHRRSPHDEVTTPNKATSHALPLTKGGSLAVDDVFLPTSSIDTFETESETLEGKVFEPRKTERRGWGEDRSESTSSVRNFAGMRSRLSVARSTDSNTNVKKSDSVNIFARDNDPFDDDFFSEQLAAREASRLSATRVKPKNDNFNKWSEPFDNFDFKEKG